MNETTPRRQVLLAYALLISLLAAAWFAVGHPIRDRLARGEIRVSALQLRIDALQEKTAGDTALHPELARRQIDRLREFITEATIDAETLEVAGSLLQKRLTEIIEKHGGEPGNIRLATDPDAAAMTVSTQFGANLAGVAQVLAEMASARPMMRVDLLSIRKRDRYLETGQGTGKQDLVVQIDVSGFWGRMPAKGSG